MCATQCSIHKCLCYEALTGKVTQPLFKMNHGRRFIVFNHKISIHPLSLTVSVRVMVVRVPFSSSL